MNHFLQYRKCQEMTNTVQCTQYCAESLITLARDYNARVSWGTWNVQFYFCSSFLGQHRISIDSKFSHISLINLTTRANRTNSKLISHPKTKNNHEKRVKKNPNNFISKSILKWKKSKHASVQSRSIAAIYIFVTNLQRKWRFKYNLLSFLNNTVVVVAAVFFELEIFQRC